MYMLPLGERNCELGTQLSHDYDHAEIGAFLEPMLGRRAKTTTKLFIAALL